MPQAGTSITTATANMPPLTPEIMILSALLTIIGSRERSKGKRDTLAEMQRNIAAIRALPLTKGTASMTRAASAAEAFIGLTRRQVQAG